MQYAQCRYIIQYIMWHLFPSQFTHKSIYCRRRSAHAFSSFFHICSVFFFYGQKSRNFGGFGGPNACPAGIENHFFGFFTPLLV